MLTLKSRSDVHVMSFMPFLFLVICFFLLFQKYEEALAESGSSVLEEREAAWSTERNTLKAEMAHFRNTAKSVTDQHQQALDRIKASLNIQLNIRKFRGVFS